MFLCFPLRSTRARCHFHPDFVCVCVKDAQHEGQPRKRIKGRSSIDEQQRLVFRGIGPPSPRVMAGNATPAPSAPVHEVLQK